MANIKARECVSQIPTYVPGKPIEEVQREYGLTKVIKLASNENPLGPSPMAMDAMRENIGGVNLYPDGRAFTLTQKLSEKYNLVPENFIIGNGSDEIIKMLAETFLEFGDDIVYCIPTFGEYAFAAKLMGAVPREVPVRDLRYDLPAMLKAITPRTKLVFVCNPNNPTGTTVSHGELESFIRQLPEGILVVLDEAYQEYVTQPDFPDSLGFVKQGLPVIILRTFSKIYGLAGLRVGYGIGSPAVINQLQRVREPFNVNRLAQFAAAAALSDTGHLERSRQVNSEGKDFLTRELTRLGLEVTPSEANFLFVRVNLDSRTVFQALLREGVIIRTGDIFGYPEWIRVTIGTAEENTTLIQALERIMGSIKGGSRP